MWKKSIRVLLVFFSLFQDDVCLARGRDSEANTPTPTVMTEPTRTYLPPHKGDMRKRGKVMHATHARTSTQKGGTPSLVETSATPSPRPRSQMHKLLLKKAKQAKLKAKKPNTIAKRAVPMVTPGVGRMGGSDGGRVPTQAMLHTRGRKVAKQNAYRSRMSSHGSSSVHSRYASPLTGRAPTPTGRVRSFDVPAFPSSTPTALRDLKLPCPTNDIFVVQEITI